MACGELANSLTSAEREYFAQLKGWDGQIQRWEVDCAEMSRTARSISDQNVQRENVVLSEGEAGMVEDLLRGQATLLKGCSADLELLGSNME